MSKKLLTQDLLHPYQHKGVSHIIEKQKSALFLDMGL